MFLALVLAITVDPLRAWAMRRGAPRWLATLLVIVAVYAIVIGLVLASIVGVARFAELMPQYADQLQEQLSSINSWLAGIGPSQEKIQSMLNSIDSSKLASFAEDVLSGCPARCRRCCSGSCW